MKKWIVFALILTLLSGCAAAPNSEKDGGKPHIVTTVFPAYDFARAAAGDDAEVTLLLPPGAESHSYEPTPADMIAVQSCDLFVYLGGESDAWVETLLDAAAPQGETLAMLSCVPLLEEERVEGMEPERGHLGEVTEMDEHVWTAPKNAAAITLAIGEKLAAVDGAHAEGYRARAADYAAQIEALDARFASFFASHESKPIVFGDRFPLRYFAAEYDLTYYAAFPGCSTQTEPSAATVAFLTDKVREENLSTVWYIEFSNHLVADAIAEATGAATAQFHSCHNVTAQELQDGATYLSLMEQNLQTLEENW